MTNRFAIPDFQLANQVYAGAQVSVYLVDANGAKTNTLAPLYDGPVGAGTLENPVTLDSEGKFQFIPYIDKSVICSVAGLSIPSHDTGMVISGYQFRGEWAAGIEFVTNDIFKAGADADNSQDVYAVSSHHTSAVFADELAAGRFGKVIDVSDIADAFQLPATAGNPLKLPRVKQDESGYELRTAAQIRQDIGAEPADGDILKADESKPLATGFPVLSQKKGDSQATFTIDHRDRGVQTLKITQNVVLNSDATREGVTELLLKNDATGGFSIDASSFNGGFFGTYNNAAGKLHHVVCYSIKDQDDVLVRWAYIRELAV